VVNASASHSHSIFNPSGEYLNVVGGGSTTLSVNIAEGFWSLNGSDVPLPSSMARAL